MSFYCADVQFLAFGPFAGSAWCELASSPKDSAWCPLMTGVADSCLAVELPSIRQVTGQRLSSGTGPVGRGDLCPCRLLQRPRQGPQPPAGGCGEP